jgi:hypothetical protein
VELSRQVDLARTDTGQPSTGQSEARRDRCSRQRVADAVAVASYLAGAIVVTGHLWVGPSTRTIDHWFGDRALAEWYLAFAARVVTHLENPFFTTRMNMPTGVNMMANTSMLGLGVPAAPITLLFGAAVAFDVLVTVCVAGTALAWYYVLSRHLVSSRAAAWIGGLVCGFAPSMTSHASWHPNLVAQFLMPFIALRVVRLREPGRYLRNGVLLGLLVAYQAFINEELLFLTALGCGLFALVYFAIAYAGPRRSEARSWVRPFLSGLGVAAVTGAVLLSYPLWWQFAGPGSYRGISGTTEGGNDLLAYVSFSTGSVGRRLTSGGTVPQLGSEDNGYFGWPLVLVVVALAVLCWRSTVVRAASVTAVTFAALSFGPKPTLDGHDLGVPGLWAPLRHLPLLDSTLPTRCGLLTTAMVGIVLAIGCDRLRSFAARPRYRVLVAGVLVAVLVPAAPLPLPAVDRDPVPAFIADGIWRRYVREDESVLFVPSASFQYPDSMAWAARGGQDPRLTHGYFLGPGTTGRSQIGPPPRPTDLLLWRAISTGKAPTVTDADRATARADLAYWRAAIVVLRPHRLVPEATRETVEALLGPGQFVGGVWLWDVRQLR